MPKSKSVNISLDEYQRLQEVEKRCEQLQSAFDRFNDAYNELLDAQQLAAEKYRTTRDPSVKLEAWADLLVATMDFMKRMPNADISAIHVITELLGFLGDVDAGRSSPFLKPTTKKPERTDTNLYGADLGVAVALVDILHDERRGLEVPIAAKKVVRLFEKYGFNLPKQIGTQKGNRQISDSLVNWRKRMKSSNDDSARYVIAKQIHCTVMERHRWLQDKCGHSNVDAVKILTNHVLPGLMGKKVAPRRIEWVGLVFLGGRFAA